MPLLTDMELPELDVFSPEFARDPHGHVRAARETGAWMAKYAMGYIPLDYEGVKFFARADHLCRMPHRAITQMFGAEGTQFARFNDHMMNGLDGEAHARLRRLIAPAFTPKEANRHRENMRTTLRRVIRPFVARGECDFVEAITKYPITVVCQQIGVPVEDVDQFQEWVDGLEAAAAQDPGCVEILNHSIGSMFGYVEGLVARRKASGERPADLLQSLLDAREAGDALTEEELYCMLILLLGGGFDTTRNQIALLVYVMTQHPQYWKRAAEDPAFVKPLIEESLRYLNTIGSNHRVTNVDFEYRGVTIPENTFISLCQFVPGRDPKANEDPETFNPDRKNPQHVTFGQGAHLCVGMFIARAMMEEAVPILARAFPDLQQAGEVAFKPALGAWGLVNLPIRFTPGTVDA